MTVAPPAEPRFAFGENWSSYAMGIGPAQIDEAVRGLDAMVGREAIAGRRLLDIGCGSGLHAVAALRLGAASVRAVDYDLNSVRTAQAVLDRHAPDAAYEVRQGDVLRMTPATDGLHDIVYSWGVLHHTGHMHEAIARAAALVAPGGLLAIALYRKTYLCWLWKHEKRLYCRSGATVRAVITRAYMLLNRLMLWRQGIGYAQFKADYKRQRGMDFDHDVADWLGGYPYESADKADVEAVLRPLGFVEVSSKVLTRKSSGILGSGCDEFVYRKT